MIAEEGPSYAMHFIVFI